MPRFATGVVKFQNNVFPEKRELFEKLSEGQTPEALFITCSDSRIETAMMTQTDPGDLFICRNAGNIVPPHTTNTGAMTATIEFATAVLKVSHIVVCGHFNCGAMNGAMHPETLDGLSHIKQWLSFAKAAVDVAKALTPDGDEEELSRIVHQQNVVLQLQHLRTHPTVAARMAKGDLTLHGWIYDIKTGEIFAYDEANKKFSPVNEFYADAIEKENAG